MLLKESRIIYTEGIKQLLCSIHVPVLVYVYVCVTCSEAKSSTGQKILRYSGS